MTTFTVTYSDPTGRFTAQAASIQADVLYAAGVLNRWIAGGIGDINISVIIDPAVATANGGPATTVQTSTASGFRILNSGFANEVATGIDPNGTTADALIRVGADFLAGTYWVDATPETSNDIPASGYDFVSAMEHELLHALAFSGFRAATTGALPADYMTPYDQNVQVIAGSTFFTGATARAVYGGNVPLYSDMYHYGSASIGRVGLLASVMNGGGREFGRRYDLNDLDLAILQDSGVRINHPTTGTESAEAITSVLAGTFSGLGGNDTITGSLFADTIDGGSGTDTVVFSSTRAATTLTRNTDGSFTTAGADGTDTLRNVERLRFSSTSLALDAGTSDSGGRTVLLLGAVLGQAALSAKAPLVGTVIGLFDQGFSLRDLSGAIMRLDIWGILANGGAASATNTQIASYLLNTVNRAAPDAATLASGVASLNNDTQGDFLWHLAESAANQTQVGLVGLASTGITFS
ncbi:MAG: hypothetical protein HYX47_21295 [Burkholderiales bacterium]|nr:hypothetical protein [Burkholderiales bacterium]